MLKQAFGESAMGRAQTFVWHSRFKNGRTSVDDDERSGRTSSSTTPENVTKIRQAIHEDRRRTINDLCDIVGIGYGTCQLILKEELHMRRQGSCLRTRSRIDFSFVRSSKILQEPTPTSFLSSVWLLPLPKDENSAKGKEIWDDRRDSGRIADGAWQADKERFPRMLPGLAAALGSLCSLPGELLRGWWMNLIPEISVRVFFYRRSLETFRSHLVVFKLRYRLRISNVSKFKQTN